MLVSNEEQMRIYEMKNYAHIKPMDLVKNPKVSHIIEKNWKQ